MNEDCSVAVRARCDRRLHAVERVVRKRWLLSCRVIYEASRQHLVVRWFSPPTILSVTERSRLELIVAYVTHTRQSPLDVSGSRQSTDVTRLRVIRQ